MVNVIAYAIEKKSWSLKLRGEGVGVADVANMSIKSTKTGCKYPERSNARGKKTRAGYSWCLL